MRSPVSVIIPCYRCADTIGRAVESIAAQSVQPVEVLLVEDASGDGGATLQALHDVQQRFRDRLDIRVIALEKNGGPGTARNAGWEIASQPYIAFLDADDAWHPNKLEIQHGWMRAHSEVVLTAHFSASMRPGDPFPPLSEAVDAYEVGVPALLVSNRFPTRSVMLKRDITQRFEPGKRYAEDYLLWLRIVLGGQPAWMLKAPLACAFKAAFGAGGLTGRLWRTERGEIDTYRQVYSDGLISLPACLALQAVSWLKFLRRWVVVALGIHRTHD
jgi:glycosyltransferase involved in cell wall biosynthesis